MMALLYVWAVSILVVAVSYALTYDVGEKPPTARETVLGVVFSPVLALYVVCNIVGLYSEMAIDYVGRKFNP